VCCQSGNNLCLHIENASFSALLFLKPGEFSPKFICRLCGICKERLISVILSIVVLNEIAHIDFLFPEMSAKTFQLVTICFCHFLKTSSEIFESINPFIAMR